MNPRFKPLISPPAEAAAKPRPFQLKVLPAETSDHPFRALSSMLPALKSGGTPPALTGDTPDEIEPKLETRRQGDQITRITVTCNCGRIHEIECEY
jgi:hypothetical protein